jgi:hypothetical protein
MVAKPMESVAKPTNALKTSTLPSIATPQEFLTWSQAIEHRTCTLFHLAIIELRYDIIAYLLSAQPNDISDIFKNCTSKCVLDWTVQYIMNHQVDMHSVDVCYEPLYYILTQLVKYKYSFGITNSKCAPIEHIISSCSIEDLKYLTHITLKPFPDKCVYIAREKSKHTLAEWFISLGYKDTTDFGKYPKLTQILEKYKPNGYYSITDKIVMEHGTTLDEIRSNIALLIQGAIIGQSYESTTQVVTAFIDGRLKTTPSIDELAFDLAWEMELPRDELKKLIWDKRKTLNADMIAILSQWF